MPLTKIAEALSSAAGSSTLFLTQFRFVGGLIFLRVRQFADNPQASAGVVQASFSNAVIESIEEDDQERDTWPLDIIGFDCYAKGDRWRFVLNRGNAEWSWDSEWPSIVTERL
jgi:hypothetical protein